jgi:hypothetical protein
MGLSICPQILQDLHLLMALAKTNNTIATIGRNIPIPFSETRTVSPDI